LLSTIFGCLDAALTIAATLNSKSFFLSPFGREAEADTVKRSFKMADEHSDFLVIYRAYCLWRRSCEDGNYSTFTRKHFLSHTNLVQIEELKSQYVSNLIEAGFISEENGTIRYPKCPRVRFAKLDPYLDRACKDSSILMAVIAASMHPKLVYKDAGAVWKTLSNNAPVAIHPSSTNFIHGRRPDLGTSTFLTYFNIQQSKRLCR
jgi:ATP-dependent RNA helicase DHX29